MMVLTMWCTRGTCPVTSWRPRSEVMFSLPGRGSSSPGRSGVKRIDGDLVSSERRYIGCELVRDTAPL